MKKKIVNVLLSAAVITTMMFFVTACGSKADEVQNTAADAPASTVQDTVPESTVAETEESTVAPEETDAVSDGQMSLEEWTKSDECIQFLDMMNEGMEEQGVKVFFEVDGDVISLVYQYTEQIEVADDAEEAMSELFTSNATLFESVRDELIDETGNENTVLKIAYRNADDSEIFSMDF